MNFRIKDFIVTWFNYIYGSFFIELIKGENQLKDMSHLPVGKYR